MPPEKPEQEAAPGSRPRLLYTRPVDEWARGRAAARRAGFDLVAAPVLAIEALPFVWPEGPFDAILFTSPRAPVLVAAAIDTAIAIDARLAAWRDLPCCCVGERTAAAARAAGFHVTLVGEEDGAAIVAAAHAHGHRRLAQFCGERHIAIPLPPGLSLCSVAVYRAQPVISLPKEALRALATGDILAALLFSPRSARVFAALLADAGVARDRVRLVVLSANVAKAAGAGWREVAVTSKPDLAAMLAAATVLRDRLAPARQ